MFGIQIYLIFQSGIVMDYIKTWKDVILKPSDFYRRMPKTGGYADPISFAVINLILNAFLFNLVRPRILALNGMHELRHNFSFFTDVIFEPILSIIGLFVLALILNILYHLKIIGGTGNHEGTLRIISYASATMVFSWIPFVGLISSIYCFYLNIVGGMIVQNVSMRKSTILTLVFFGLPVIWAYWKTGIIPSFPH
jgi:hypothetical protein